MLTKYKKSDMIYTDYKWTAGSDNDNPKIIGGTDHSELNRTEGYEMVYFISSLDHTWGWSGYPVNAYQKLEKIIRSEVPSSIRTHSGIKVWIERNYQSI